MIERHVTFDVRPELTQQFKEFFVTEYKPAMSMSAGFCSVELLVDIDDQTKYKMVIAFDTLENSDLWRASKAHAVLSPILKSMYTSSQVLIYKVAA
jgi:heme-degrading monooxygenase HmoA